MEHKLQSQKQKRRYRLPLHVYLSYLLACTMLATGVTFSSYVTGASCSTGTAKVAAGAAWAGAKTKSRVLEIDCRGNVDDFATYTFYVSNSSGSKKSEVALGYDVTVTLSEKLPDGVTVMLDGESGSESGTKYTFSKVGTFGARSSGSEEHTLTFRADTEDLTEKVPNIQVDISVYTYQID